MESQHRRRWRHVRDLLTREADQAQRPGTEAHERCVDGHGGHRDHRGPSARRTPGGGERPEAALAGEGPHQDEVGQPEGPRRPREAHEVDRCGSHQPPERRANRMGRQADEHRSQCGHQQVGTEEPQQLGGDPQQREGDVVVPGQEQRGDQDPEARVDDHRTDQTSHPSVQPGRVPDRLPVAERVRPGPRGEEQRHDLEDPGGRLEGRRRRQGVPERRAVVPEHDQRHERVPEDDDDQRTGPHQVDDAIAGGRGRGRHLGSRRVLPPRPPEIHADSVAGRRARPTANRPVRPRGSARGRRPRRRSAPTPRPWRSHGPAPPRSRLR